MTRGLNRKPVESRRMHEDLKCYATTVNFWCEDRDSIYIECNPAFPSKMHLFSSLPFAFELPKDKCVNLDKLEKGVKVRWFWRSFTINKKLRVEIMVEGKWIPIYVRRDWKHGRGGR